MSENLEIPWSVEDTIENLRVIKVVIQRQLIKLNRDGKGKQDAVEADFDFNRAIKALNKQIPKEVIKSETCSQICPECGYAAHLRFCANCGQALKYGRN